MSGAHGIALIWRLGAATTLIVLAFAMAGPVLAVLLQQRGHSTAAVGAFAMIPFLLIALLIPVVPRVLARFGLVHSYRAGAALQLAAVSGYVLGDGLLAWCLASAFSGVGAALLWNATESMLAREAPPQQRGRVMGLYQTALGAALALGPFVPSLLGGDARAVLWAAVVTVAGCCVMAVRIPLHASPEPAAQEHAGTWQALRHVPLLALLAFAGGVFEAGLSAIGAAHAAGAGRSLAAAASVAGAIGVGSFLCQYPAGMAADRFSVRRVMTAAALLLLAASVAAAGIDRWPWLLWAVGLVWGGVGGALYTLSMVQVAHEFEGRATAGGAAAMITGYTVGGTLGPVASGAALQWGGAGALSMGLSGLAVAGLVAAWRLPRGR